MIIKEENATWIPAVDEPLGEGGNLGWIDLNGELWEITKYHCFDDFGTSLDTFTIALGTEVKEIYSYDEGETFTFDVY